MSPLVYMALAVVAVFVVGGTTYAATTDSGADDPNSDPSLQDDSSISDSSDYGIVSSPSFLDALVGAVSQGVTAIINNGYSQKIVTFADAIAHAEGYGPVGNVPTRANNPGDLSKGDFGDTGKYLIAGDGEQVIQYATAQDGFNALYEKLQNIADGNSSVYSPSMTIAQMAAKYAGNSQVWAANVTAYLSQNGVPATQQTTLQEVLI